MTQEDPDMGQPANIIRVDLNELGMEAQSILKSIRTENTKLCQSKSLAQSDVHYFRARHNYYRLSLLRLLPAERKMLEPVLAKLRENILNREARMGQPFEQDAEAITPFITPVEDSPIVQNMASQSVSASSAAIESSQPVSTPEAAEQTRAVPARLLKDLSEELELMELALEAKPSEERNQKLIRAVQRIRRNLDQEVK